MSPSCDERPPRDHRWRNTHVRCHHPAGHDGRHSWDIADRGPWAATLVGGPAAEDGDRVFAVGPIWAEIAVAKMPGPQGWVIVGGSGIGPTPEPWPGEATYLLVEVAEALDPDDGVRWVAYYRQRREEASGRRDPEANRYWGD